jgi:hypothetical protein
MLDGTTGSSGHATTVATNYFGNTASQAPGITTIDAYQADDYINNYVVTLAQETRDVQNHSYIGYESDQGAAEALLRRFDYIIDRDDYVSCMGLNNGSSTTVPQIWGYSYNGILVGLTSGNHSNANEPQYEGAGRIKPDIVAPMSATSWATPVVSSSAALLIDHARNEGLADAEHSQVVKALLMAGATKDEFGGAWNNTETQPLDATYGAGELNIYNSYHILDAGQFDASNTSLAETRGWDYGTSGASAAQYFLDVPAGYELRDVSALVTWNRDVYGDALWSMADLSLSLQDATGFIPGTTLTTSDSPVDNVEHIYLDSLGSGRYVFEVNSAGGYVADYGLAWMGTLFQIPEPGSLLLLLAGLALCGRRPHRKV